MVHPEDLVDVIERRGPSSSFVIARALEDVSDIDAAELERLLDSRPDLFVVVPWGVMKSWALTDSKFDPKEIVLALERLGPASVGAISRELELDKGYVLALLKSYTGLFLADGYGPPMWSLKVSSSDAIALIRSGNSSRGASSAFAEMGAGCGVQFEDSLLKQRVDRACQRLVAMRREQDALPPAEQQASEIDKLLRRLARVEQRLAARELVEIEREVERLGRALHPSPGKVLPAPHLYRPAPKYPGQYGRPRCRHSGRCTCS